MLSSATRDSASILGGIALLGLVLLGYLISSGSEGFRGTRVLAATQKNSLRPIALLPRRSGATVFGSTAFGSTAFGSMVFKCLPAAWWTTGSPA